MGYKSRFLRQAGAFCVMFLGSAVVFATVLSMNGDPPPKPKSKGGAQVRFSVRRQKKPPAKQKVRRQPRRVRRRQVAHAPVPRIGVGLSGIDLGIPSLGQGDLGGVEDSLIDGDETVRDVVMTEGAVDVAPKPISRVAPKYPARARAQGISGHVTMKLLIDPSGRVVSVKVVDSSGGASLERAAVGAVRRWRFSPGLYKGNPVKVWAQQTLRFRLN